MDDIKKLLGQRIRELRKSYNISQQELAEKINIDPRNLSNIETGKTFPSKSLLDIAYALNVPVAELFEFEHIKLSKNELINYINSSTKRMNDTKLKVIYKFIKTLQN